MNTGALGGLTVTAPAPRASGGTIQHKTGADASTTAGLGVFLSNTSNVSLSNMQLNDFDNYAIRGTTVTGFSMTGTTINGTNGNNNTQGDPNNEGSVRFDNLLGTASITNSTIGSDSATTGAYNTVQIINTVATPLTLTVTNSNFYNNNMTSGNKIMLFESDNSANMSLNVSGSQFGTITGIAGARTPER